MEIGIPMPPVPRRAIPFRVEGTSEDCLGATAALWRASGFFLALWNSDKQPRPSDYEQDRAEYEGARQYLIDRVKISEPEYQETADELLNDMTGEKMHLWTWADQAELMDRC
jgi:hypothetical protein